MPTQLCVFPLFGIFSFFATFTFPFSLQDFTRKAVFFCFQLGFSLMLAAFEYMQKDFSLQVPAMSNYSFATRSCRTEWHDIACSSKLDSFTDDGKMEPKQL
ncbi:hypothetical protein GOP47_0002570 [Adiantum capillus-veneris]|uniref:Uncharacterized protein n=1 Tax=Adiantum capillus-veneris TaxID=13818 RepID=A0A9D4VCB9_ADICA|nr:hypothetical protein GOP47_0002570 [Adiantum capillus-veneris]